MVGQWPAETETQQKAAGMMPDRDEKPSMLQIALDHARQGYRVFPVIPNGKVPAVAGWNHQATTDPDFIKHWWTQRDPVIGVIRERDHNVGVLCGEDLTVLDIDVKKADGLKAIGEIAETFFEPGWNATRTVRTPSGGLHLYFKTSEGLATTASRVAPGIDTRGVDGYVLAPGSIVNGKAYEVVADAPVADIEPMLATMIGKPVRKQEDANVFVMLDTAPALSQGREYLAQREGAIEGAGGNDHTYRTAARLKDLGLSQLAAFELMMTEWNAKCRPEWSHEELATIVSHAFEYGKRPPGVDSAAADFDPIPDDEIQKPKQEKPKRKIKVEPYEGRDPKTIPPRPWLYGTFLLRGAVAVTAAMGGTGKSVISIVDALALASGRKLLHDEPMEPKPCRVWLWNAEDDNDELDRRTEAIKLQFGITSADLGGRFMRSSGKSDGGITLMRMHNGEVQAIDLKALEEAIVENQIDAVFLDPLVSLHHLPENDNGAMDTLIKALAGVAERTRSAIHVAHHVRKTNGADTTADDMRGGSSIHGAVRMARVMTTATPEDAEKLGLAVQDRYRFLWASDGKANYAPRVDRRQWYELVSVDLDNGTEDRRSDSIGVPTVYHPREEIVAQADLEALDLGAVLGDVWYRENSRSSDWVGHQILRKAAGAFTETDVRKAVKMWMQNGKLEVEQRKSDGRKDKLHVRFNPNHGRS